ncbi:splicing factor 3A subunit 2, partial [Trichinella spiralis]|uniref:splicing factor 3A subunit 2 n=1 Tax=Trichinella spiralis TaxID=6334 RepID=UPI0001EFE79C
ARRAAKDAFDINGSLSLPDKPRIEPKKFVKIGRPGYKVTKQRDPNTGQQSLSGGTSVIPRHRFHVKPTSKKIEPPDKRWQYLLFAAEPYETIAFKIPSREVDKGEGKFWTLWNKDTKQFFLQFAFRVEARDSRIAELQSAVIATRLPPPSFAPRHPAPVPAPGTFPPGMQHQFTIGFINNHHRIKLLIERRTTTQQRNRRLLRT